MIKENKFETYYFLLIFLLMIIFNLFFMKSLFHPTVFAAILAGSFYPLFNYFNDTKKLSREVSSTLCTIVILIFIIAPIIYLLFQISKEAISLYGVIKDGFNNRPVQEVLLGDNFFTLGLDKILSTLSIDISRSQLLDMTLTKVKGYSGVLLQSINAIIGDTFVFAFNFILMIIATFAFFYKGNALKDVLFNLSPLPSSQEQKILDRFNQMNLATMVGNGIGGIIQGGIAGICFAVAGLPSVFLWTTIMVILAFIPLVGISIVTIPAVCYLYLTGAKLAAVLTLIITVVASLIVENWFKPKFIGNKISVDGILVFFYIIAGMNIFGMAGIFYGPLICILFLTTQDIYIKNYLPHLHRK